MKLLELASLAALAGLAACRTAEPVASPAPLARSVTAIDVLLEPDAAMTERALAANARLRASYPAGFALDETHRPHVTLLQRFVRTADLDRMCDAVGEIVAREQPSAWKLEATSCYCLPFGGVGLAGIAIEPTEDLVRLQRELVDAVAPFAEPTGTAAAFVTTEDEPGVSQATVDYVAGFVPNGTGARFHPHVTVGAVPPDRLDASLAERFEAFAFSPAGVAVYQLGDLGTARKELASWRSRR